MRHDTTLGGCDTRGSTRDMARSARAAGARVVIQIFYHDRKGPATRPCVATQRCDTAHQCARACSDTPATRPGTGYDTTGGRPRHGA